MKKVAKYILEKIEELKPVLYLQGYRIKLLNQPLEAGEDFSMETEAEYPYRTKATITFWKKAVEKFETDREYFDDTILHELLHIVVAPLADVGEKYVHDRVLEVAEESVVDQLTVIIAELLNKIRILEGKR